MLSVATLSDKRGNGASSVVAYLKATEYYRESGDNFFGPPQWLGPGAKDLGLHKLDTRKDDRAFEQLLLGFHPTKKDEALVQGAGGAQRKMGFDFTFSADKTVSVLLALADSPQRERIIEAHHRATEQALAFAMSHAVCRTGKQGKGKPVAAEGYVVRRVDHFDSRDGDPNLHSHCVVLNSARGPDGKWRTLEMQPALETIKATGALYRARLAAELREIGYDTRIERERDLGGRETGQVWHRVYGLGRNVKDAFSKRRKSILAEMAKGLSAQEATLRTRQGKGDVHPTAIALRCREVMQELKRLGASMVASEQDIRGRRYNSEGMEKRRDGLDVLQPLHRTESSFNRLQVIEALAKEGHVDAVTRADEMLKQCLQAGEVIELTPDAKGRARYATAYQVRLEMDITKRAVDRLYETRHHLPDAIVEKAIRNTEKDGITFNKEQVDAVRFVCQQSGGTACIVGRAGTGKTVTSKAYIAAFEAAGYQVIGASTAKDAAKNLSKEAGVAAYSCAQLLADLTNNKRTLTEKTVIVLDEAGMVGAKTLAELQQRCDEVGAKLLMLGDPLQLQPVEAGSPFRRIIEATGATELKHIRRQRQDRERGWANDFYTDKSANALLTEWGTEGRLKAVDDKATAIVALVDDYMANPRGIGDKLILANTNKDVDGVTEALRSRLKREGVLTDEVMVEVSTKIEGETKNIGIAIGDRLSFTVNDKRLGVNNGQRSTVLSIDLDDHARTILTLQCDGEDKPRRLVVEDYPHLRHAWASTNHAAQGLGRESVYWLASPGPTLNRSMGLVAFTRTKEDFTAYMVDHHRPRIEEQLDDWRLKQSVDEMMKPAPPAPLSSTLTTTYDHIADVLTPAVMALRSTLSDFDDYIRRCWRKAETIVDEEKQHATKEAQRLLAEVMQTKPDAELEEHRTHQRIHGPPEKAWDDLRASRVTIAEAEKELKATSTLNIFKRRELQATLDAATAEKKAAKAVIYKHRAITEDETHPWMVEAKEARDRARPLRVLFDKLTHETSRGLWIQDAYIESAAPRIIKEVGEHPEELGKGRTLGERLVNAFKAFDQRQELQRQDDERARALKNMPKPFELTAHPGYIDLTRYPKYEPPKEDDRKGKGKSRGR